jgi:hypothetical protein
MQQLDQHNLNNLLHSIRSGLHCGWREEFDQRCRSEAQGDYSSSITSYNDDYVDDEANESYYEDGLDDDENDEIDLNDDLDNDEFDSYDY